MAELITEPDELTRLEAVVEQFRGSFVAAGQALRAIRDQRLYREQFVTFEEYCAGRWGFNRNYGNKLIRGVEIVEALGTIVPKLPSTESHVRELAKLDDPDDQAAAWTAALEAAGGKAVTAKIVRDCVNAILPPKDPPEIVPELEFEAIRKWLLARRDSWPPDYRHTFVGFVQRILEQMEPSDVDDRGAGADCPTPDPRAA